MFCSLPWSTLRTCIKNAANECLGKKERRGNGLAFDEEIKEAIDKRNSLFKKKESSKSPSDKEEFLQSREKCSTISEAKRK